LGTAADDGVGLGEESVEAAANGRSVSADGARSVGSAGGGLAGVSLGARQGAPHQQTHG